MASSNSNDSASRFWWVLSIFLAGVLVWVLFFDSHSLLKRYYWHRELESLRQENATLRSDIQRLRTKLEKPIPDSVVERIAREEYGMKRPGETIHHVERE